MELNNRELAVVFWSLVFIGYILLNSKMQEVRGSLKQVLKTLCSKPIVLVVGFMTAYVVLVIYVLLKVNLWDWVQLKNTIIWTLSVALLPLFSLDKYQKEGGLFKEFCFSSFRLIAIIHFVLGVYVFNIWVELVLIPSLLFLGALLAVAQANKNYQIVANLITNFLSIYGLILIGYTAYMVVADFENFASKTTFNDFLIPSLLTILYLPFLFLMVMYAPYERANIRISSFIKEPELIKYTKPYVLLRFHFRFNLLDRWLKSLVYKNITSKTEVRKSIDEIYSLVEIENNPPEIKNK